MARSTDHSAPAGPAAVSTLRSPSATASTAWRSPTTSDVAAARASEATAAMRRRAASSRRRARLRAKGDAGLGLSKSDVSASGLMPAWWAADHAMTPTTSASPPAERTALAAVKMAEQEGSRKSSGESESSSWL